MLAYFFRSSHGNLTKASWVAGGYWHSNNWNSPSFTSGSAYLPAHSFSLSRCSSQSSGIGSIPAGLYNRSPSDSRPGSVLGEVDRLSVFSDNLEPRFESNLNFRDGLPTVYQPSNELSRKMSPTSVASEMSINTSHQNHWSWLPFMLGFSLAVNVCVIVYFMFLHTVRI